MAGALTFDPFAYDVHDDPYPIYRRLRRDAPVHRNDELGFWTVALYEDVARASVDWAAFSSAQGTSLEALFSDTPTSPMIINMDPPEHTRMRKLVSRAFTPRRMAALEPSVRTLTKAYLAQVATSGSFDLVADLSARVPINVISEMLGIPHADRERVRLLSDDLLHREPGQRTLSAANQSAAFELGALIYGVIQQRRSNPTDDLIGVLVRAELDGGDSRTRLTDDELVGFCVLLAVAGNETVTKLVANAVLALGQHPNERRLLVEQPELVPDAVEEALRFDPPSQYQGRVATQDVRIHDTTVPAGDVVLLLTGSANRDERMYDQPDSFKLNRPEGRHLGFGHGIHTCLGAWLARVETKIMLEELLEIMPEYQVRTESAIRMHSSNVRGFSNLPVEFEPTPAGHRLAEQFG